MSKLEKAQITYRIGEGDTAVESVIRFHSVISEEHDITTEITKFPVQSGFNISNHAVKKNRKVSIAGVVTNHLVIGAEEFHEYGGNNSRLMFSTLKDLVRQATPCDVATNYSSYTTVIFTRFKTKLQAGKTDVMDFVIIGEEVQVSTTIDGNKPTLLEFTPLSDAERAGRVTELLKAGVNIPEGATISETTVDLNDSFQFRSVGENGEPVVTTYEKTSYDATSKSYGHVVHTSDTEMAKVPDVPTTPTTPEDPENPTLPDVGLNVGATVVGACLKDGLVGIGEDLAEETINTALGDLKKTTYGAAYSVFGVNGDRSFGQILTALGSDCLIAGTIGVVDDELNPDDFQDHNIPTWEETLEGAKSIGDSIVASTLGVIAPTTLTKLSKTAETSFFGDVL